MPKLESARTFVRSAFDAARALASDERVARGAILQIVYSLACAEEQHQLVHDDLHANNICLQPCGVWQVLFDDDQVAYFIPPGVRAFVIDFGNCYSVMTPVAKLLGSMSLLYDLARADFAPTTWCRFGRN